MTYRIKTVENLTGISRNTITAWERRYSLIAPTRDGSGYRAYSEADINKLRRVKSLLDQGYQIGEVLGLINQEAPADEESIDTVRDNLQERLLDLDRDGAMQVLGRLRRLSMQERLDQVYMPILYNIGELWAQGKIGVGHEHFVSVFVRDQLLVMLRNIDQGPRRGPKALCAGFPKEPHELGLLTVALRLALEGHRVTYLGADMPSADVVDILQTKPVSLVCSSLMRPRPADEVLAWAREIRDNTTPDVVVSIGGPGVAHLASHSCERLRFCATFDDLAEVLRAAQ